MFSTIPRNTLLSEESIETLLSLPVNNDFYATLFDLLTKFQEIKKFASEIHTEIHLVKPILKSLGYVYESKPKFFEEHIKDPDVALFTSEDERVKTSQLWGTKEYYRNTLGIVLLKRYGRNLSEGISGFYLEFENKMPVYQMTYMLKNSRTPWGILTNGKYWILIRRPYQFERRAIEIDLEKAVFEEDLESVHLFGQVFSCLGLKKVLPDLMEQEREQLLHALKEKKTALHKSFHDRKRKVDYYPTVLQAYHQFFSGWPLPATETYLGEKHVEFKDKGHGKSRFVNRYDHTDICSYLFTRKEGQLSLNLEHLILGEHNKRYTKEDVLSLKILDITPGFGNLSVQLVEGLAYIAFVLPYKDKNTYRAEWEEEGGLKEYIIDNLLFGIERSHVCFDILKNTMRSRFGVSGQNYRLGNPLIGTPLKTIQNTIDSHNQLGLFSKPPKEVIHEFKELYSLFFSLSDRIKENLQVRIATEAKLMAYTERIRDLMDVITATYFTKTIEDIRVQDMLFNLDGSEATWNALKNQPWFIESKEIAKRNGFFHIEIEFPFLLNNAFDFIFVQPSLNYSWEEEAPIQEATKAYIKRGMAYLKQDGKLVILSAAAVEQLVPELKKSKRYEVESAEGLCVLRRKI